MTETRIYNDLSLRYDKESQNFMFEDADLWKSWMEQYSGIDHYTRVGREVAIEKGLRQDAIKGEFMRRNNLVTSNSREICLHQLAGLSHRKSKCSESNHCELNPFYHNSEMGFDHAEQFRLKFSSGVQVITSQPYDLTLDKYQKLENICSVLNIGITISYLDGWHYPGSCPLIMFYRLFDLKRAEDQELNDIIEPVWQV